MTTKHPVRRAPLLFLLLLACSLLLSCAAGPSAADVAADRDRWRAARDVTADGKVDEQEAPLWSELLVAWDAKLTADEHAAGAQRDARTVLAEILRVYGAAAVTVFLAPELQARAPEMFRLVDRNGSGMLEETELLTLDPASPVFAMVVATTAQALLRHRR